MQFARLAGFGVALTTGVLAALTLTPDVDAAGKDGEAAGAARAFLASLPPDLRQKASFPLDSDERTRWFFVPRDRVGVSLLTLEDEQAELLGPLLATALSPEGLLTARGVIKHENILRRVETAAGINALRRDPGLYYTSVFGTPSATGPWSWRFEGHHLSLNVTQLPGEAPVVAPVFVGANPARVPDGADAGFRLLAAEEDLARELVTRLPEAKRKLAIINDTAYPDIITGNDPAVRPLALEGLAAAEMSAEEQQQLRRLIEVYTGRLTPASARDILVRLDRAGFGKLRFAWAGGIESGQKHYYRVHGPTLLIEYDNTQNDGNHIHTSFRDLERDFGGDVMRRHLAAHHSE